MRSDKHIAHSIKSPSLLLWKAGFLAVLVVLAFSFFSSDKENKTTPSEVTLAGDNKSTIDMSMLTAPKDFPNIRIKNFGQMDNSFYRGAQPRPDDYQALAALGIKTIIDLRDDPTDYEKPKAEALGMHYVNIPMSDTRRPPDESVAAFFAVANDEANRPFYVHCIGGRHRTGLIGAVYRFDKYNWNYDQAFLEMKNYDYYSRWGHGAIKDYVRDYYEKVKFVKPILTTIAPATSAPTTEPVTPPPPPKPKE